MTISLSIRWIGTALVAIGVWFAAVILLTIAVEPTRAVIVFAPDRGAMINAITTADVALLDGSVKMLKVTGASPGFVAKLYSAGAWLVLPARAPSCVTPPARAAARNQARG